mmetsp:Transcript_93207/g.234224  ORF Transcript_93207/g.234224 Transcript_93207/m.234224 type:complete len:243 (+) Transcript_93207:929-1657(+)
MECALKVVVLVAVVRNLPMQTSAPAQRVVRVGDARLHLSDVELLVATAVDQRLGELRGQVRECRRRQPTSRARFKYLDAVPAALRFILEAGDLQEHRTIVAFVATAIAHAPVRPGYRQRTNSYRVVRVLRGPSAPASRVLQRLTLRRRPEGDLEGIRRRGDAGDRVRPSASGQVRPLYGSGTAVVRIAEEQSIGHASEELALQIPIAVQRQHAGKIFAVDNWAVQVELTDVDTLPHLRVEVH